MGTQLIDEAKPLTEKPLGSKGLVECEDCDGLGFTLSGEVSEYHWEFAYCELIGYENHVLLPVHPINGSIVGSLCEFCNGTGECDEE